MAFDTKTFMKTKFQAREEEVPVPELQTFFDADEKPVWVVRGLSGIELGQANEAAERNRNISALIDGLLSDKSSEKADAVKKLIGTGQTPQDIAKRLEMFVIASVKPTADLEFALKFCENYPVEFFQITNKITQLTGQGRTPGKLKSSGETKKSEQK